MKIFVLFLVIYCTLFISEVKSQSYEREYYNYTVSKKIYYVDSILYVGLEDEFYIVRERITDSTFIQMAIYSTGDTSSGFIDTFKIINNNWYINSNGYYYKYLNIDDYDKDFIITIPYDENHSVLYKPLKSQNDTSCITFIKFVKLRESINETSIICFNPTFGITKIFNGSICYVPISVTNKDIIFKLDKIFNTR